MNSYLKYLKYKNKYLFLKEQLGGAASAEPSAEPVPSSRSELANLSPLGLKVHVLPLHIGGLNEALQYFMRHFIDVTLVNIMNEDVLLKTFIKPTYKGMIHSAGSEPILYTGFTIGNANNKQIKKLIFCSILAKIRNVKLNREECMAGITKECMGDIITEECRLTSVWLKKMKDIAELTNNILWIIKSYLNGTISKIDDMQQVLKDIQIYRKYYNQNEGYFHYKDPLDDDVSIFYEDLRDFKDLNDQFDYNKLRQHVAYIKRKPAGSVLKEPSEDSMLRVRESDEPSESSMLEVRVRDESKDTDDEGKEDSIVRPARTLEHLKHVEPVSVDVKGLEHVEPDIISTDEDDDDDDDKLETYDDFFAAEYEETIRNGKLNKDSLSPKEIAAIQEVAFKNYLIAEYKKAEAEGTFTDERPDSKEKKKTLVLKTKTPRQLAIIKNAEDKKIEDYKETKKIIEAEIKKEETMLQVLRKSKSKSKVDDRLVHDFRTDGLTRTPTIEDMQRQIEQSKKKLANLDRTEGGKLFKKEKQAVERKSKIEATTSVLAEKIRSYINILKKSIKDKTFKSQHDETILNILIQKYQKYKIKKHVNEQNIVERIKLEELADEIYARIMNPIPTDPWYLFGKHSYLFNDISKMLCLINDTVDEEIKNMRLNTQFVLTKLKEFDSKKFDNDGAYVVGSYNYIKQKLSESFNTFLDNCIDFFILQHSYLSRYHRTYGSYPNVKDTTTPDGKLVLDDILTVVPFKKDDQNEPNTMDYMRLNELKDIIQKGTLDKLNVRAQNGFKYLFLNKGALNNQIIIFLENVKAIINEYEPYKHNKEKIKLDIKKAYQIIKSVFDSILDDFVIHCINFTILKYKHAEDYITACPYVLRTLSFEPVQKFEKISNVTFKDGSVMSSSAKQFKEALAQLRKEQSEAQERHVKKAKEKHATQERASISNTEDLPENVVLEISLNSMELEDFLFLPMFVNPTLVYTFKFLEKLKSGRTSEIEDDDEKGKGNFYQRIRDKRS